MVNEIFLKNKYLCLVIGITVTVLLFTIISIFGIDKKLVVVLVALPVFTLGLFNINAAIVLGISLLFLEIDLFKSRVAVFAFIPILLSFAINHKASQNHSINTSKNPFLIPYILYLTFIFISLINCSAIQPTLVALFDFVSMSIIFFSLKHKVTNYKQIKIYAFGLLSFCALNGIIVLIQGLPTGRRVFGFMGVTYVDFVCIAIVILLSIILYQKKKHLLFLIALSLFFLFSLFVTQTRSTILALSATLATGALLLFFNSGKFDLSKKSIIKIFIVSIILIVASTFGSFIFLPGIFERFSQLSSAEVIEVNDFNSFGESSILTRLLIWLTSLNAFIAHPIIGIGAYSFRFQSFDYNIIPIQLYKMFVKGLSPHVTYLAVLTETGVLGLMGFLVFLFSTIKMSFSSFKNSITKQQIHYSFGILLLQLYIVFSMCITDAWLFGQCGILWSLILGVALANYCIVKNQVSK